MTLLRLPSWPDHLLSAPRLGGPNFSVDEVATEGGGALTEVGGTKEDEEIDGFHGCCMTALREQAG